jgi:serine/threonine-protein kinase
VGVFSEKCRISFAGEPRNPFLIMDFVAGRTLESFIRRLPTRETMIANINGELRDLHPVEFTPEKLDIAIQIVNGLDYLHRKKLVHRDIKPANIFLSKAEKKPGRYVVRLGDFGVVKWGDFHASLTTGVLTVTGQKGLGTLKYMSPEQAVAPHKVSTKSDVYCLGITLFELLTDSILVSSHHVTEVILARLARGTTLSRFYGMAYQLEHGDQDVAEAILDMHLRGVENRPSIDRIQGVLRRRYEQLTGTEWLGPF